MSSPNRLEVNLANRRWLVSRVRAEIVGPDPAGAAEDLRIGESKRLTWGELRKPRRQANGEEVLWQDPPSKRYGAGILFPIGVCEGGEQPSAEEEQSIPLGPDLGELPSVDEQLERRAEQKATKTRTAMDDSDDYGVTLANAFKPSAIGLSLVADFSVETTAVCVELVNVSRSGADELQEIPLGSYKPMKVQVGDPGGVPFFRTIWLRTPMVNGKNAYPRVEIPSVELLEASRPIRTWVGDSTSGLQIVVVSRGGYSMLSPSERLITISLVNRRQAQSGGMDEQCVFQAGIRVKGMTGGAWIRPYPGPEMKESDINPLSDDRINRLLYRHHQTFAIGHGCAADWPEQTPAAVSEVWTDVMPAFETPSTSSDLFIDTEHGKKLVRVSMRKLAGLDPADDGSREIGELVKAYRDWIQTLKAAPRAAVAGTENLDATAAALIGRCETCLARIEDGLQFLKTETPAGRAARVAFALANRAMLIAQLRATRSVRVPSTGADGRTISWAPKIVKPDPATADPQKGYWRAFQIAFLLMSVRGIADPASPHRETVDLIWFPTGGGKTEAYLGLTAFTILFNRLSGPASTGADVIMRYTLRLLTAQQFQRAALLFCALENIRQKDGRLGDKPFRIGLWVGGSASPNTREEALRALQALERDSDSENPFILLKCPWCAAKFGPSSDESAVRRRARRSDESGAGGVPRVLGYSRYSITNAAPKTVVFRCNDPACDFGSGSTLQKPRAPLPIVVIDEDLLADPPNLVIGTVDKFAMLAWKPEVRRLFGIGAHGRHDGIPPTLIIQDELHLISGPLGSMVGAYETVIERLCRKDGAGEQRPKIVASTATISRATEQISHLYGRNDVFLFPPSGLEAGDSFFSRDARNDNGTLKPGRLYLGILASAHGSFQTTLARVFACLLQHAAVMETDEAGRDPWWTLLCFFNSLRELGGAASLFVADARDYLRVILDRHGLKYDLIRKMFNVSELTSRIRSDQVPRELERLERELGTSADSEAVDACLASNIIEVGVDVSRLSLMAIAGQPKTTSQYIQVSSRIGRDPEKPGLVTVLYGQTKPRDRSHFERFRPYHQRLYAQVEPTSVTPFSPPAVDRALHGIVVAAVRQFGEQDEEARNPDPFPLKEGSALLALVEEMVDERVNLVAPDERDAVLKKLKKRLEQWRVWQPREYGGFGAAPKDPPLLHPAGSAEPPSWDGRSWPTMSSLRDVDASCEAEVTSFFNQVQDDEA